MRHRRSIARTGITHAVISLMPRRSPAGWAGAGLLVSAAATVFAVVGLVVLPSDDAALRPGLVTLVVTCLPYGLVGSLLIDRRPDLPFGWLLSATSVALAVGAAAVFGSLLALRAGQVAGPAWWGIAGSSVFFLPVAVQGLVNVRFPDGRPSSRWGSWLELLIWIGIGLGLLSGVLLAAALATAPKSVRTATTAGQVLDPDGSRPLIHGVLVQAAMGLQAAVPAVILLGLIAGLGVVVRTVRARGLERQQLKWRAAGVVVALALFPFAVTEHLSAVADYIDPFVFVATLAIPVLRYRLWAIDTIVRRSVVYAMATAVLVGSYALIMVAAAGLASQRVGGVLAAIVVVLAVIPVRAASQRAVDGLFFGHRRDPYRALADVGRRLEEAAAPGEVLPAVVGAVAHSLRLPYVAIEHDGEVLAASGTPAGRLERWALRYEGAAVGRLVACPRRGEPEFDERDKHVLADIAHHAGPAVRAEALSADLRRSRQRLVTAREEERRRLRRDLHDGLGPALTGLGLNLDAARVHLAATAAADPGADSGADLAASERLALAEQFLAAAKEATVQVISDIRTMAYDLRPPALDELGLAGALSVVLTRIGSGPGPAVDLDTSGLGGELPAAVEVAAYRAIVEAVTNVVRHSHAATCVVRLGVRDDSELWLEVRDDGRPTGRWPAGVGLSGMQERAEELGGTLRAGPDPAGGGLVEARYPLEDISLAPPDRVEAGELTAAES